MCTCRAARLPWRSFLGRSAAALHLDSTCREILWDAVDSLVGFGAPNNYFASFSVGRKHCICLVEFFANAQLPNSPCVFSWDAVASLFIITRLTTTSAAFPLAKQIVLARLTMTLQLFHWKNRLYMLGMHSCQNSPCVLSCDAVARLCIVARLTTTSAAFPLAEQIVYAW